MSSRDSAADTAPTSAFGLADWWTLANAVSLFRLALTPVSVYAVFAARWWLATLVFTAAVASDLLDGPLARRRGTVSALGGVLDHTADAVFVAASLWAIAYVEAQSKIDLVPGVLPWLVALAFAQYLLDSKALTGKPLRASWLGRVNGIAYFVIAGAVMTREATQWYWLPGEIVYWFGLAVTVSTLASMADRLRALTARKN